jgi:ABC-type glutathione transport system ATPase component
VVLVQKVSKLYRLYQNPSDRIRELIPFQSRTLYHDFWALREIHFSVEKGETLGIVGRNGCGKSTLLHIICGILQPTTGRVVALLTVPAKFWTCSCWTQAGPVQVRSVFHEPESDPMVGILISNRIGMEVYGTNTRVEQMALGELESGDELDVEFRFECWRSRWRMRERWLEWRT